MKQMAVQLLATLLGVGFGVALPQTPTPVLTLRDTVEILTDYDVRHVEVPKANEWYGLSVYDDQQMWIVRNTDLMIRRKTAIHELLHVNRRLHGIDAEKETEEAEVTAATNALYLELFGK